MTMKEDFIEVILCRLESSGEEAVEGLRASAFGNYLKYKDHIAKSQKCICYVVSRQVEGVPDPDENAMWFKVNGEVIRFSKVEFALVTGLRFGTSQFNPYEDHDIPEMSLYTRLFKNEKITSINLWNLFKSKDVLAAAREASSREEAEKVAVEKRKREVDAISEEVTKKVKAEIQSPEFIQMLANAIVSLLPGITSKGAGEREQQAAEKERGLFWEKSAGAGDNQAQIDGRASRENEASTDNEAVTSSHIQNGLMVLFNKMDNEAVTSSHIQNGLLLEQPMCSKLPNTQEIAAEFAWNYDIHHNVFGGESPYSTQETQSSIPTKCEKTVHTAEDEIQPRPVRKKFPAALLKSPFRVRENRGTDFNKYMQNKDREKRNVGLPFAVGKDYFEYIKDVTKELEHMHMEPYVAILAKDPHIAKVHWVQNRFVAMGVQFQKEVEDVWKAIHGEKPEGWVPDHNTEEVIPAEHMEQLEQFAEGLLPEWGGLKKWIEAEKLVLLCYFDIAKHWAVCTIHFKTCMMILWDSNEHKFNDHIKMLRKKALLPLRRILPQLSKHIGYYISNPVPHKYTEWPLYFPLNSANKLHQRDSVSCGPLALKSMENRLTDTVDKMMYKKNLLGWRAHIAETIYNYSTHEITIAN
ncbi:hypothetical protein OROGR_015114 [Orobanche gracilis]